MGTGSGSRRRRSLSDDSGAVIARAVLDERLPRFTQRHVLGVLVMVLLMVVGSVLLPMMDAETLKPHQGFPAWLRQVSYATNVPIKLGVAHAFLYGCELALDPESGERHIGQRLTTLWLQFFEDPRWGQHFHMQLETVLQVADAFDRDDNRVASKRFPQAVRVVFAGIAAAMALTNLITSIGYHTFFEQMVGAVLAIAKLFFFDYLRDFEHINVSVGHAYTDLRALAGGVVLAALLCLVATLTDASWAKLAMHPTTLATTCFIGCRATRAVLGLRAK